MWEMMYAVITIDLVGSRKLSRKMRTDVDRRIRWVFNKVHKEFANEIETPFDLTVGDEYQGVLRCPEKSPAVILTLRSGLAVAPAKINFIPQFRAAIGLGDIYIKRQKSARQQDGPAFWLSREVMLKAKEQKYLTMYGLPDEKIANTINTITLLMDAIASRWNRKQYEAIWYRRQGYSLKEISKFVSRRMRHTITYQAIQERLTSAQWAAYESGIKQIEFLLIEYLSSKKR